MNQQIRNVLKKSAGLAVDIETLPDDHDLYQAGLKSLAAVRVLMGLEDQFGVVFPASMMGRDVFASIASIEKSLGMLVQQPV